MASPGVSPRGQFASVEEYVEFVGGQRPIKKVGVCAGGVFFCRTVACCACVWDGWVDGCLWLAGWIDSVGRSIDLSDRFVGRACCRFGAFAVPLNRRTD
jgi:hypothetical protein